MKTIKPDTKIIMPFVKDMIKSQSKYFKEISEIEKRMQKKVGDKDIEFFWVDGEIVGVGTPSCPEKMKLLHISFDELHYDDEPKEEII